MSQIPRMGGSKPMIKSTTTTTSKIPGGGSRTTTTTKIRELQPCSTADPSLTEDGAAGCGKCPGGQSGQRNTSARPAGASGIRPPSGRSMGPAPQASRRAPPAAAPRRAAAPARQPQPKPPMPGQYNVPAAYGPMSRQGKGMPYSSPEALRGQMEQRLPKDLKYENIKTCPGAGARDRSSLQGTTMGDMFSGNYNVYGGPSTAEEMVDSSELDGREKIIRQKLQARGLEKLFPQLVEDIMRDTKLEFKKVTHYAGANLKVKDKYPEEGFVVQGYKFMGKTKNYKQFLWMREQTRLKWILHYGVMRKLLAECVSALPYELFTIKINRLINLEDLQYIFKDKVQYTAAFLHEFYKKVSAILDKDDDVLKKRHPKLLPACTGIYSVHVSRSIAHTIQGVVKFTESVDNPPYLKLYVDFEASLVLTPTADEVIQNFCQFLDNLVSAGEELYVLEKGRIKGYETRTICLCLTKEFIDKCKRDIEKNIAKLYEPVEKYLDKLGSDFKEVYSDINSESFFQSITDILFEDGCRKIEYYKRYIHKVAYIPNNEYFKIGQLVLINYREKLHDSLQLITDSIFKNLSSQHLWEVNDICDTFTLIHTRATQLPMTTEELIEIGKFMTWIRDEQLNNLNERVHASLRSLCNIITLGLLDEDHMATNSTAINWLDDILPIIEQHLLNYEQLKFEAEEKLQKVIEDINILITAVYPLLVILDEMDNIKLARKYIHNITLHMTKIKEIYKHIEWINREEVCLSFPKSTYAEFENLKDYVYPFYHLLKLCLDIQKHVSVWQYGQFDMLNYESTNAIVEKFCKELTELQKTYRKKLRQAQDENLPIRFKGTVDDPDLLNWPAPLKLCATAYKILEDFKPSLTVMQIMCNDALRSRHWKAMSEIAGLNLTPNAGTTLKKIMEIDLKDKLNEYEIISTGATKEKQLLDHLDGLKMEWETIQFTTAKSKEDISILTRLEDIETVVDDHMIKLLNMRGSVFVKPCEKEVLHFYDSILKITYVLTNWKIMQKGYLKLFPIFSIGDIAKHVPNEKSSFEKCDSTFKMYIDKIVVDPVVMNIVCHTEIVLDLEKCLVILEEVQKGVNSYLEVVRLNCPRLYYISNEELINLIATNSDLTQHNFLIKIFPGFDQVRVTETNGITALLSLSFEEVPLRNPIKVFSSKTLDETLIDLENEMINTMKYKSAECYKIFKKTDIKELIKRFPQQSLQLVAKVYWTDQVENALKLTHNIKLLIYKRKLEGNIKIKIKIINENDVTNQEHNVIRNLLLLDLNNQYLLSSFLKQGYVISDNHFDWQVQLRYYYDKSLCTARILHNSILYGYEYLGNSNKIILTPMTDRCFRTLLNAYFLNFFGLVRGGSETGKSMTVKTLAEALGFLCFSFSCTKNISFKVLEQLLKGTALCGSWLALENLEYIQPDVFSVISQDLLNILEAKKQEAKEVFLGGMIFNLNPRCFVCGITSLENKLVLPENLKVLLRTFTLCKPDLKVIGEIYLISRGVNDAKMLAKRLGTCLNMLEDGFSFQKQYSFGLRGLRSVLKTFAKEIGTSSISDVSMLYSSIRKVFGKFLVGSDATFFEEVLSDTFQLVFPDVQTEEHRKVQEVLGTICNQLTIFTDDNFTKKVFDVYSLLKSRRSVLIVGDSFSGKTTVLKACAKIFETSDNSKVHLYFVNPKYLNYSDIMGKISQVEKEDWTDGVLLRILRGSEDDNNESIKKWVVFDGYIDPSWTDNFPAMLEDGNIFLESQEMFLIGNNVRFIMEVDDLKDCSPSIISCCGISYFPSETIGWILLVDSWLKTCQSLWLLEHKTQIEELFKWFIPPCLEALQKLKLQKYCQLDDNTLVKNTLTYFQLILDDATSQINRRDEDPKNMSTWIHATFLQAGMFGFGSFLEYWSRQKFDEFYKQLWRGQSKNYPYPESVERLDVSIPQDGMMFEYCYLYKQRGAWKLWVDLLKNEKIVESQYLGNCIIPTVDTMRCNFLLDLHVQYNQRFLIVGPRSTGRSLAMKDCFVNRVKERYFETSFITFNRTLTANTLQSSIISKLNKRKAGYFSPSAGKRFLFFIDDLQCSVRDSFGISESTELLRQLFDHNTWYDRNTFEKIYFENTNFVASMAVSGKCSISKRFLRHFNLYGINEFSSDTISKIYSQSLLHCWKKSGFPSDIVNVVNQIVAATLAIFNLVKKNLKPTLSRCQYIFDLTTFSKVMYGCSFLKKDSYDANKKIYLKLWVHEVIRVIADRFNLDDIKWMASHLKEGIGEYFSEDFEEVFGDTFEGSHPFSKLFFGTFNERHLKSELKHYEEVNFAALTELCNQCLREYNEKQYKLDLIFFDYALEKLTRICRILSMPNENALLLGLTGCGRESLTKFSSFMYKQEFFQPVMTRNYDLKTWNQEFKNIFKVSGGMDKECAFLITEEKLELESFLEIIDYYVRDGELTDLYTLDEKQEILELCRLAAQGGNRNLDISSHRVFLYFNKKCRENLHIFLCLNSGSDTLRKRVLKYPSLVNRFNVILWKNWPDTALQSVANFWIGDVNIPADIKEKIIEATIYFHKTCQGLPQLRNFVTPKAYIHLAKIFSDLIVKKQDLLSAKRERFLQGLSKFSYAETQIVTMQMALAEYQPQLEAMTRNAIEMTNEIALETIRIEKASASVRKDEKIASEQAAVAQVLKSECESELAQAIPILEDAISALNTLKPSDITLVKSMKNPPDAIKLVMASVCVIKDVKPDRIPDPSTGRKTIDYWGPSKRILGDMNFLQALKDFDKDHIKLEIMAKIRKEYLPHKDFKPHVVAKASSAAEGLCKWIIAMDMYDRVAKEVAPKKEKLNKAEREYGGTMMVLNEKKEAVVRIEAKLAQLNVLLEEAVKKQNKLQTDVNLCNRKLNRAQKLIGGLSGEKLRWTEASENLQKHYDVLSGDIILSSAVIAYLAPLNKDIRCEVIGQWCEYIHNHQIPSTEKFDFSQVLSNEVQIENWKEYGLPVDSFYIENAVIFNKSKCFCLLLDPQSQAVNWILKNEARSNLVMTKFSFKDWLSSFKYCMTNGKPILIKDTKGYIPPCLYYFLYQHTFTQGDDVYVTIGEQDIKMHPKFRLYIVCILSKVPYSLELRSRITIINFSLSNVALKEELLKIVTEIERPEIKKLTNELVVKNRENKAELKELEVKILNILCESEADILEDEESIVILDKSKVLAKIVKGKQEEAKKIDSIIQDFKKGYVHVAKYVADLFFCLNDLQQLHHFYQFSLDWFKNIYFISIVNAGKSRVLETRCQKLCDTFTYDLYKSVSKGLFEKDKLLFTFWLASGVAISKSFIERGELLMFLGVEKFFEAKDIYQKPSWITNDIWKNIQKLESLETFQGLLKSIVDNESSWKEYIENTADKLPEPWHRLSDFGKLMLLKVFRPEKLYYGIIDFIQSILGDKFLSPMFFNTQEVYNETYSLAPTIFILTPGIDVLKTLHTFAGIKQVLHKFAHLSMGDKNLEMADELIRKGQKEGSWVLLQNCQLQKQWLDDLEQRLESLDFENTHENFRLFLTTEPEDDFPLELVQNSIKIVDEPPNILRKNLLKIYSKIPITTDDFFYGCPGKQDIFSKLLYSFCHFHFVMQERQKVSNWNVPYRFEESDLMISLEQLRNIINEEVCIFEKVYTLLGECNYNGYLENVWEKRLLMKILSECVNEYIFEKGRSVFNGAEQYGLPNKNDRQDYLNHILNLPSQDDPKVLYLNEYEFLKHKITKTNAFLSSGLKMVQSDPKYLLTRDEFRILSMVDDILNFVPQKVDRNSVEGFQEFILREIQLYNNLIGIIRSSLKYLRSALGGDIELTPELEAFARDLAKNRFPKMWKRVSYPSLLSLSSYVKDLSEKVKFFEDIKPDERRYWIGAFFFPRALVASVKIKFSRKVKVSLDVIGLEYEVLSKPNMSIHNDSIIIDKLFLLGAKFDIHNNQLTELSPKTYYDTLAPISIKPIILADKELEFINNKLKCYVFKTEALSDESKEALFLPGCQNFVTEVTLLNESAAEELFNMSSPEVGLVEEQIAQELMERSMLNPDEQLFAKSQALQCIKQPPMIQTPAGMEQILQQTYSEKRVERNENSETVVKNLAVTDMDDTGVGRRVTISEQHLNPDYGLPAEGKDVVTVKETVSITPSYTSTAREVIHETITPRIDIDPAELAQMVEDENQDVENTLRMAPPDLSLKEDRYAVKKRLQKLRLNTESMILLEESVVCPAPTADEALTETPPEALANIMHTVESGVTPECAPDQIFHTLFEEKLTEQSVVLSSVGPGPLQDVVVPQTLTKDIHKESMTHDLTDLTNIYKNVTDAKDWPPVDLFDSVMDEETKSPKKEIKSRAFKPLEDEEMPWAEEDLEPIVNIVGAEPAVVLDPANVPDLETSGNLETELTHGIEYFVEADPVQYVSRVQLRGSQPPPWFPGYIYSLPEFPDVVKIAKNPDEVFLSSWRSCQPKIIPDTSMSILH